MSEWRISETSTQSTQTCFTLLVVQLLSVFKDVGSLAKENEVLKGKTMCKICGQRQVKVVFMPCGHLVCCLECGLQITHCPVCSSAIKEF